MIDKWAEPRLTTSISRAIDHPVVDEVTVTRFETSGKLFVELWSDGRPVWQFFTDGNAKRALGRGVAKKDVVRKILR
jgi:hypothetical protein